MIAYRPGNPPNSEQVASRNPGWGVAVQKLELHQAKDLSVIYNLFAVVLSIVALCSTTLTAVRQTVLMNRSNHLPAYLAMLDEFRSVEFNDHYLYVTEQLRSEHDPLLGLRDLPVRARGAIYDIGYFFQNFVALRRLEIVDDQILTSMNFRIIRVWQAIEPFILRERELMAADGMQLMEVLEYYARTAREVPPAAGWRLLPPGP
jgi:hypothetical protein